MDAKQWQKDFLFLKEMLAVGAPEIEYHLWTCDIVEDLIKPIRSYSPFPVKAIEAKREWTELKFIQRNPVLAQDCQLRLNKLIGKVGRYLNQAKITLLREQTGEMWPGGPRIWWTQDEKETERKICSYQNRVRVARATLQAVKKDVGLAISAVLFGTEDRQNFLEDLKYRVYEVKPEEKQPVAVFMHQLEEVLFDADF